MNLAGIVLSIGLLVPETGEASASVSLPLLRPSTGALAWLRSRIRSNTRSSTRLGLHVLAGFYVSHVRLKSGDLSLQIDVALLQGQFVDFAGTNKGPEATSQCSARLPTS
jgi:hypothetical protein